MRDSFWGLDLLFLWLSFAQKNNFGKNFSSALQSYFKSRSERTFERNAHSKTRRKRMSWKNSLVKAFHFIAAIQFFYALYYECAYVLPAEIPLRQFSFGGKLIYLTFLNGVSIYIVWPIFTKFFIREHLIPLKIDRSRMLPHDCIHQRLHWIKWTSRQERSADQEGSRLYFRDICISCWHSSCIHILVTLCDRSRARLPGDRRFVLSVVAQPNSSHKCRTFHHHRVLPGSPSVLGLAKGGNGPCRCHCGLHWLGEHRETCYHLLGLSSAKRARRSHENRILHRKHRITCHILLHRFLPQRAILASEAANQQRRAVILLRLKSGCVAFWTFDLW